MRPVLILGDEPRIVVNIARSLHRYGVPVDVGTLSSEAQPPRSQAIRRGFSLPDPRREPAFSYAMLLEYIESEGYDQLIPASDTALAMIAGHYRDLVQRIHVSCPPPPAVQRVLDKSMTVRCAEACGVPIPASTTIATLADFEQHGHQLQFPVIAKPRDKGHRSAAPFKMRRFDTLQALGQAFREVPEFGRRNLIQAYCPGEGVGLEVLMHDGRPLALFQHRRLKELPSTGGVSIVAVSEPIDPLLTDYAVRLLRVMEWEGVAMVEFRVDRSQGRVALMEVNGRYWGSLGLSLLAGVDFPWYEWQLAHGQRPDVPCSYRSGVTARWTSGWIQRLCAGAAAPPACASRFRLGRELISFATDCAPPTRDLLWSLRDPRPGFDEMMTAVRGAARRVLRGVVVRIVPETVLSMWCESRRVNGRARRLYLTTATARLLRVRPLQLPPGVGAARAVLFVCHGNILRSPMAAALLRQALDRRGVSMEVYSAGVYAKPFHPADPRGVAAAWEFGIDLTGHRADVLSRDIVDTADAIIVMDRFNEADVLARYFHARGKVFCFGLCHTARPACLDIDDPYHGTLDDVRRCYAEIQSCINGFVAKLSGVPRQVPPQAEGYAEQRMTQVTESIRAGHARS